jgi:hypothetical protein
MGRSILQRESRAAGWLGGAVARRCPPRFLRPSAIVSAPAGRSQMPRVTAHRERLHLITVTRAWGLARLLE